MATLYERIEELCHQNGITGGKMCNDLGISRSTMTELRKGRTKTLKLEKASKIAKYFGVTVEYLLGQNNLEQKEKASSLDGKKPEDITFDDFSYAMHNESGNLSAEDKEILLNLARDLAKHRMEKDRRKEK